MKYELKQIPFEADALDPFISATTIERHHGKHHQAYLNNLNVALEKHPEIETDYIELLKSPNLIPSDIKTAILNNGGGVYNHDLYFSAIGPVSNTPKDDLLQAIKKGFGSFEELKTQLSTAALTKFGSGWAYLVVDKDKNLKITTTSNQDVPFNVGEPILAIDVWEHAYYLDYQNRRANYIDNLFKIINWDVVSKLYLNTLK